MIALVYLSLVGHFLGWSTVLPPKAKSDKLVTFPIGIDRSDDTIRLAWIARKGNADLTIVESPIIDGNAAKTVRAVLDREHIATRDCVLGVRAHEARLDHKLFRGVKIGSELDSAARMELRAELGDEIKNFDVRARMTPSGEAMFGAIRKDRLAEYQRFAKEAGLKITAIDNEGFAWKRIVSGVDAVVSTTETDASLTIFDSVGVKTFSFAKSDWIEQLKELILRLRQNLTIDARTFHAVGDLEDQMALGEFASRTNSTVTPLEAIDPRTGESVTSPPWLLAFGLATYGLKA